MRQSSGWRRRAGRGWRKRDSGQDGLERREGWERQNGLERPDRPERFSRPAPPAPPACPAFPGGYFFVEDTGFGGGLSTYSFRNHGFAPLRAIFTSTWRRRLLASGFF